MKPDKVHCRRTFFEALQADPEAVEQALKQIAALYKIEDQIREQDLTGERKRQHRAFGSSTSWWLPCGLTSTRLPLLGKRRDYIRSQLHAPLPPSA
jgi:hypothetical protein